MLAMAATRFGPVHRAEPRHSTGKLPAEDTVRKTAKVVDSCFGQATRMVDVKHEEAFQGLFMACVSGLEAVS